MYLSLHHSLWMYVYLSLWTPDIITGYNIFGFDFDYILKRLKIMIMSKKKLSLLITLDSAALIDTHRPPCQWTWGLRVPTFISFQSISISLCADTSFIAPQHLCVYLLSFMTWRLIVCAPVSCLHPCLLSRSVPDAKSHAPMSSSLRSGFLHWPCLGPHWLHRSVLTIPDWTPWTYPGCTPTHGWNPGQNRPHWPQTQIVLPGPHGHHVMIVQPRITHATSSAGHLAGGPGTWGPQPSFPSIYFCLVAC